MAINVLIADQERIFADALAARLDDEDDIGVMGAVQVEALSSSLLAGKPAEVVLLDGDLPGDAAKPPVRETLRLRIGPGKLSFPAGISPVESTWVACYDWCGT